MPSATLCLALEDEALGACCLLAFMGFLARLATESHDGADEIRKFIDRCHAALERQSRGEPQLFLDLWSQAEDVTIMAAIGGYHVGFDSVSALLREASKTQSFDSWSAENLVTAVDHDMAFSVELEHYDTRATAGIGA